MVKHAWSFLYSLSKRAMNPQKNGRHKFTRGNGRRMIFRHSPPPQLSLSVLYLPFLYLFYSEVIFKWVCFYLWAHKHTLKHLSINLSNTDTDIVVLYVWRKMTIGNVKKRYALICWLVDRKRCWHWRWWATFFMFFLKIHFFFKKKMNIHVLRSK